MEAIPRVSGKVVLELQVILGTYEGLLVGLLYDLLAEKGNLHLKFQEKGHVGSIRSLATTSGLAATGGSDEIIKLYNLRQHTEVGTLMQHEGTINCLQFYQDQHLISASDDGSICLWSTLDWSCTLHLKGHKGPVYDVAVHPSGKVALSVGRDKTMRTWDLSTGECAYIKRMPQAIEFIQWTPIGDGYLTACNNSITVFSVESGTTLQQITIQHHIYSVVYITDEIIAVGSESRDIFIYSVSSGELLHTLKGHASRVKSLSFVSGANLLFSGSSDGTVYVWNISLDNLVGSNCVSQCTVPGGVRLTSLALVYPEEFEEQKPKKGKKRKRRAPGNTIDSELEQVKDEVETKTIKKKKPLIMFKDTQEDTSLTAKKKRKKKKKINDASTAAVRGVVTVEYEGEDGQNKEVSYTKRKQKH